MFGLVFPYVGPVLVERVRVEGGVVRLTARGRDGVVCR